MKKILLSALQFVLFLLVFAAGSFLAPFHVRWWVTNGPAGTRYFIADGLLLMLALWGFILLVQAITKRIRTGGVWTTAALLLAAILGFAIKLGFVTHEL